MPAIRILALTALALAACTPATTPQTDPNGPAPSGGSAGAMGESYCETIPTNPEDVTQWSELCNAGGRR